MSIHHCAPTPNFGFSKVSLQMHVHYILLELGQNTRATAVKKRKSFSFDQLLDGLIFVQLYGKLFEEKYNGIA